VTIASSELSIAEAIARCAHARQVEESTGDPYILHVQRVVDLCSSDDAKIAAWLHDVLEDSDLTQEDLRSAGIPSRIITSVVILTHRVGQTYAEYIDSIKNFGDPVALEVKIADLRDHLRPNCPERLRPRYEAACKVLGVSL
jgi:hypothetical protein